MSASPAMVLCRVALAGLASVVAQRRPAMRPVAVALWVLAGLDGTRLWALPVSVDRAIWLAWPGVSAALSWNVWRGYMGAGLPILAFAVGQLGPGEWPRAAWHVIAWLPYLLSPAASLWAWWGKEPDSDRHAAGCAAVLAWSGLVDISVGALAHEPYLLPVAHAISVVTWVALVAVLGRAWHAPRST